MSEVPLQIQGFPVERAGRARVAFVDKSTFMLVQGSLAHQKTPTPGDPPKTLGIGLR